MQDLPVDDLLTVDQAIAILDAYRVCPQRVTVRIDDASAVGCVLAEDVRAGRDEPAADRSLMDGYAVNAGDLSRTRLRVIGEVAAGRVHETLLSEGTCVAIMTGAPLPPGAAAVVPVEHVTRDGDAIVLHKTPAAGQAVARAASYLRRGDVVLRAGAVLTPPAIGLWAVAHGRPVGVWRRPRVGVLTGGDEIVPAGGPVRAEQTFNASAPMLRALVTALGGEAVDAGHAADTPASVREKIEAAGSCDALMITGGMSVGAYDHVPAVLRDLGYAMPITKLRIKPGKPFVFATRDDARAASRALPPAVFGLPGNPVSAYVCALLLAARVLRRMAGGPAETPWRATPLAGALPVNGPREFYQPAVVQGERVTALDWKGSADLLTLATANALIRRPANEAAKPVGERSDVMALPG